MKTTNLKWIAIALSVLMLMQSCKVYHGKTATVDEAVLSQKRVIAKNFINRTYRFNNLQKVDDKLYGKAKRSSKTAKDLSDWIIEDKSDEKWVVIELRERTIKEYRIQNKTLGTILTIATVALICAPPIIVFVIIANNGIGVPLGGN